ncbi:MAG TPA: hypothetical protein VGW38_19650 [Chloroflexota bacterium]|nr:hypothetical protein [Chloroflexota bacterium]
MAKALPFRTSRTVPIFNRREGRILSRSTATFGVLTSAFVISALYQAYRATIMEIPEDAFTVTSGAGYAAFVGVSALLLTRKRWAWWAVSALVLFLLLLGPFYYYPEVTTARDMGPIDWLEASVFMGLLSIAGFVCTLELLGVRLVSGEAGGPVNN